MYWDGDLVYAPEQTTTEIHIGYILTIITGILIGGGYAFVQLGLTFVFGFIVLLAFLLLGIVAFSIRWSNLKKSNKDIFLPNARRAEIFWKRMSLLSIYGQLGSFKMLLLSLFLTSVFYWLVFHADGEIGIFGDIIMVFGLLFISFGLFVSTSANLLRLLWRLKRKEYGLEYDAFLYTPSPPKKRKGKGKAKPINDV